MILVWELWKCEYILSNTVFPVHFFLSFILSLILDLNVFRTYKSGRHHFDFKFVGVLFSELSINKLCDLKNVDQIHDIMRAHRWFVFFDCTARCSKLPRFFSGIQFHWPLIWFSSVFAISLMDTRLIYDRNAIFTFCQRKKKMKPNRTTSLLKCAQSVEIWEKIDRINIIEKWRAIDCLTTKNWISAKNFELKTDQITVPIRTWSKYLCV